MRIGEMRERAGLTKTQLAERLGVDLSTVCKWESGINTPTTKGLLNLADLFGCTLDELCGRNAPDGEEHSE